MTKNVVGVLMGGREERSAGVCLSKQRRGYEARCFCGGPGSVVTVLRYKWSSLLLIASCFIAHARETGLEIFWNDHMSFHLPSFEAYLCCLSLSFDLLQALSNFPPRHITPYGNNTIWHASHASSPRRNGFRCAGAFLKIDLGARICQSPN